MLDRSRTNSRSPGDLRPGPTDASSRHYWLMRRVLPASQAAVAWPSALRRVELSADNAQAVHRLLLLARPFGGGRVADFECWWSAFDSDPEFDRRLCLVVEDGGGIVAVAQCWTSAFIRYLVVHPRAQRRGVGLAVLHQVFQRFSERGEGHVDLKVMESNVSARQLYERAGMRYVQRNELDPD